MSGPGDGAAPPRPITGGPALSEALRKAADGHKYGHGHALVLSGPAGRGGAARLAARGALRIGAGLVTVGCPMRAVPEHAARLDAIMVRGLDGAAGLSELLEDRRINAVCLGPGLGLGLSTMQLVIAALKARRGTVLDADALTRFAAEPRPLFDALHPDCVLTPHAGEFGRLFPDLADRLSEPAGRAAGVRAAALRAGCTVLLKGPLTMISGPDGAVAVHAAEGARAAPWLATAGSGDVLAGFVTGLMARGLPATRAAETAAWLHVECALRFGPGLISEDIPEQVPRVFADLGL